MKIALLACRWMVEVVLFIDNAVRWRTAAEIGDTTRNFACDSKNDAKMTLSSMTSYHNEVVCVVVQGHRYIVDESKYDQ